MWLLSAQLGVPAEQCELLTLGMMVLRRAADLYQGPHAEAWRRVRWSFGSSALGSCLDRAVDVLLQDRPHLSTLFPVKFIDLRLSATRLLQLATTIDGLNGSEMLERLTERLLRDRNAPGAASLGAIDEQLHESRRLNELLREWRPSSPGDYFKK